MSFESFWFYYPKKSEKLYAIKCFNQAIATGATPQEIIDGAKQYAAHCLSEGTPRQYIKNPSTWLNKGCWMDVFDVPSQSICSPEESRRRARIASYEATGKWLDDWGARPERKVIPFVA